MNILVGHVHGSRTTASFVHGPHRHLLPTPSERGPFGAGPEPGLARRPGAGARAHAPAPHGLDRFRSRRDALLADLTERPAARVPAVAVAGTNGRS